MDRSSVEQIIAGLNGARVHYLVVGGLAVVAYGHLRFTADVDLLVDLDEANLRRALAVFRELGYKPRAPVALEDFADSDKRAAWVRDKGLTVFSMWSDLHPATEIDLFVDDPVGFDDAYARAVTMEVAQGIAATFIGLDDLIRLKRTAGRPQDLLDIERLEELRQDPGDD